MCQITYWLLPTIFVLFIVRKYRESFWGRCRNNISLAGKIAIVTGANSGIGFELAKELALRNARVILACRNLRKAQESCNLIQSSEPNGPNLVVIPMELDLASLYSIKNFADKIKSQYKKIHILVNNAGVSFPDTKRFETKDGIEVHFGVNHLGHFYLTNQLLEPLTHSSSRVVIISSSLHEKGEIIIDNLNNLKPSKTLSLYANSKLANIYFAQELARRTEAMGIKVYACCPGWVYTGLFKHSVKWFHYFLIVPVAFYIMRSPNQGAQTPLYCATDPDVENETGLLYRDCKYYSSKLIFYDKIAAELWEESENMINSIIKSST